MCVCWWLSGEVDLSRVSIRLGPIAGSCARPPSNEGALTEAGVPLFGYGEFIAVTINFLILAFIIFRLVRYANKMMARFDEKDATPAVDPADVVLLREIREIGRASCRERVCQYV